MNKDDYKILRDERSSLATAQQRAAANPLKSVWVEASAGTGKTKVLSDRVFRLLLSGVKPSRILCITYTKAGAAEMKSRISERLSLWSVTSDEELETELHSLLGDEIKTAQELAYYKKIARTLFAILLDTPGGLKIQTINSFCEDVLKRFPLEAGISPQFNVLDDNTAIDAMAEIKKSLLDNLEFSLEGQIREALIYLTDNLSETSFPKVMDTINKESVAIQDMLKNYANIQEFFSALKAQLHLTEEDFSLSVEDMITDFISGINIEARRLDIKALLCEKACPSDIKKGQILEKIINRGPQKDDYFDYSKQYIGATLAHKDAIAFDEKLLSRMQQENARILALEEKLTRINLYKSTWAIFTIADEIINRYTEFKRKNNYIDYTDQIILVRDLLANTSVSSWVLFKLDGGIDHIMVDEAQDTSPNQWEVIKSLSSEFFAGHGRSDNPRTVFVVGDRKQSIFSFQGADPEKFDIMSKYFATQAKENFSKINLGVSFRSSSAVLELVDHLFHIEEISSGVVSEGETVSHIPYRAGEFGRVEIWPLIIKDKQKTKEDDWNPKRIMEQQASPAKKMANMVAQKISDLVKESQQTSKPLRFGDFMVLVQSRNDFFEEFIRACKDKNVNISGADKLELNSQIVVQDLISLGRFLLLPTDDLSLAEVLKSPLFGLTDDDLIELCYNRGNTTLWSRLGNLEKYSSIYQELQVLFNKLDFIRPYELYNFVLTKMNGRYKFTERMGFEVEDAIDEFINLTISFEKENIPSLTGFINWITRSVREVKRNTEQKDVDAVRLMTAHGSKGLQAPIVFLPDTAGLKQLSCEQGLLFDDKLAYYPLNKDAYEANCLRIRNNNNQKLLEEKRRLLYVALTRAEDRLYICGYTGNSKASANSWYDLCKRNIPESYVDENGLTSYEFPEVVAKKTKKSSISSTMDYPAEDWIFQDVADEESLAKPFTPSKIEDEEELDSSSPLAEGGNFYRRGNLIHKMLQFLPQSYSDKSSIIDEYLAKNASDFSFSQQAQIKEEVLKLLNNPMFSEIFGENSRSEVAITGEVDGKIISARLDKLVILPEKIMIVDFKTNRPAAKTLIDTPKTYLRQMEIYNSLVSKIYPNKIIESYILWTNETRMMRVS